MDAVAAAAFMTPPLLGAAGISKLTAAGLAAGAPLKNMPLFCPPTHSSSATPLHSLLSQLQQHTSPQIPHANPFGLNPLAAAAAQPGLGSLNLNNPLVDPTFEAS